MATNDIIKIDKKKIEKYARWGIIKGSDLQKPLTREIVNQALEFVRKAGSERAAERKAKRVRRMLTDIEDNSQDLKDKL